MTNRVTRFEHRHSEQAGQHVDELIDHDSGLRFSATNHGAELISIRKHTPDGQYRRCLYRDGDLSVPASGWKNHATVMGYYIHRLRNEHSLYEGDEIRGGNHSFIRNKVFAHPDVRVGDKAAIIYSLPVDQIERTEYPRKVSFRLEYRLCNDTIEVVFHFTNEESGRPAHVSFGLHPGFAVTSVEQARVLLPAGRYRRHLAPDNFLSGETVEFESTGGPLPAKPFELPGSFLIEPLETNESVIRLADLSSGREVAVDLETAPYFTVWSDLNPFVCVEPCWGFPDHQQQEPFEKKLGIQIIPPGSTLTRSCSFQFS